MAYSQAHPLPLPFEPSFSKLHPDSRSVSFEVDHSKLNPKFEAYKLVQDDPSSSSYSVRSYGLPSRPPRLTDLYQSSPGADRKEGKLTFAGLDYKKTKERALHQVFVPSSGRRDQAEPFAAYIDANRFVVVLTYDAGRDKVVGHPVHRLSGEEQSLSSLASVWPTEWVASGGGTVVLIRLQSISVGENGGVLWISESETKWRLPLVEDADRGARIKACKRIDGKVRLLIQSTKTVAASVSGKAGMQGLGFQNAASQQANDSKAAKPGSSQTLFKVQLFELDETTEKEDDAQDTKTAGLLWSIEGEEPLITATLGEQEVLLGSEAPFHQPEGKQFHAGNATNIPQPNESFPIAAPAAQTTTASRGRRRAPHFSWAQTSDTVTIAFALPSWINKSHIRAHFSLGALSLSFTQDALDLLDAPSASSAKITELDTGAAAEQKDEDDLTHAARMIASGRYVSRPTCAEIDPTGSLWTVERARGMSLLTLHLEKRHEGTRWMQVFANRTGSRPSRRNRITEVAEGTNESNTQLTFKQAKANFERMATGQHVDQQHSEEEEDNPEDNEDDVPETMNPSELINMLEGLQKYTVDEESPAGNGYGLDRTGFNPSSGGTSLSLDQPSLLKDNLEEEDANVGRNFVVSSIARNTTDNTLITSSKDKELTLLATTLPSNGQNTAGCVVVKHDLDGAIFTRSGQGWEHVATMPALAFVLASKRDAQRVYIHRRAGRAGEEGEYVVLAFESAPRVTGSGSSGETRGAGNLFLYYSPASDNAKHASSRVARLGATTADETDEGGESASGALLGVCAVHLDRDEGQTLVGLCENRMLLLQGLL
ncbi:uncharacterized protein UDID_00879 [Ustilago sp. UG-2017a]|nr:uncharacterized protein UDID_00879 [Ustilago sp. UG-2017a]